MCLFTKIMSYMLIVLILSANQSVDADIITVEVEGVVNTVGVDGRFELDGSVNIGSVMTGTFVYDSDATNLLTSGANGEYAIISLSMTIGNYVFTHEPTSSVSPLFTVYTTDPAYYVRSDGPRFNGTIYVDGSPKTFDDITYYGCFN
jgi:hypothetical protein